MGEPSLIVLQFLFLNERCSASKILKGRNIKLMLLVIGGYFYKLLIVICVRVNMVKIPAGRVCSSS